jgi:hypothetical protein
MTFSLTPHCVQLVRTARPYVARPKTWTRRALACKREGRRLVSCHPWDPAACKFSAIGALMRAAFGRGGGMLAAHAAVAALGFEECAIELRLGNRRPGNAETARRRVLEMFDRYLRCPYDDGMPEARHEYDMLLADLSRQGVDIMGRLPVCMLALSIDSVIARALPEPSQPQASHHA